MTFSVFTVYDSKLQEFCPPFVQRDNAVERTIQDILKSSSVPAADLTLWHLGSWDSETASLVAFKKPVFVDVEFLGSLPEILPFDYLEENK